MSNSTDIVTDDITPLGVDRDSSSTTAAQSDSGREHFAWVDLRTVPAGTVDAVVMSGP